MGACTRAWQSVTPAIFIAGLISAPVCLDLQQGGWVAELAAYARGSGQDGAGGGVGAARGDGSGHRGDAGGGAATAPRGEGLGGRGETGGGVASVARGDGSGGRGGEETLATARDRYNRALGATAQITAKAKAGSGKQFDTAKAVFVFSEGETETLIRAGWAAPQARAPRAVADHGQKVRTYIAIAIALGYSPYVGATKANFGDAVSRTAPGGAWRDVNFDLNGDGIVDERDVEWAQRHELIK
jgi:hypothetical protein